MTSLHPPTPASTQALAGPGLPDHLHHGAPGHAEAEGGVMADSAQLPPGHGVLLRGPGARPPPAEDHLPQEPGAGGLTLRLVFFAFLCFYHPRPSGCVLSFCLSVFISLSLAHSIFMCLLISLSLSSSHIHIHTYIQMVSETHGVFLFALSTLSCSATLRSVPPTAP